MDKLEIEYLSRHVLYAALVEGCGRNCPNKLASEVGNEIALEEVAKLARKIGRVLWGRRAAMANV